MSLYSVSRLLQHAKKIEDYCCMQAHLYTTSRGSRTHPPATKGSWGRLMPGSSRRADASMKCLSCPGRAACPQHCRDRSGVTTLQHGRRPR